MFGTEEFTSGSSAHKDTLMDEVCGGRCERLARHVLQRALLCTRAAHAYLPGAEFETVCASVVCVVAAALVRGESLEVVKTCETYRAGAKV